MASTAVDKFLQAIENAAIPGCDAWSADATLDATVPNWRMHKAGADAIRDEYSRWFADPAHFDEFAAKTSAMVHEFPGWTDELRSLQVPTLLIFGDRDFSPLPDVVEMFELLPDAQLAVLPGTTHVGVTRRPGEVLALITPFLDGR